MNRKASERHGASSHKDAHQVRMCVACRGKEFQKDMLRIRCSTDGAVTVYKRLTERGVDGYPPIFGGALVTAKNKGRSCYVHDTVVCVSKLSDERRLKQAFKGPVGREKIAEFVSDYIITVSK